MNLAERIKQRKREIVEFLRRYSVAVCGADDNGVHIFGATGFFLALPHGAVLVTAEHVITRITGGPRAALHGRTVDVEGQACFASSTLALPRNDADIATIQLSSSELAQVPPESLVHFDSLAPDPDAMRPGPYFLIGFHEPNQEIDRAAMKVELMLTHVTLTEAKRAFYVNYRKSRAQQLLLGGRPSRIVTPSGRGGVPHFHGMSGSPVWLISNGATPSIENHPPLVGIFVAQPNNSRKILRVDRAGLLIRHLKVAHPNLL